MNFKSNKGVVGIDIAIAMIILMVTVPTMFGIAYNVTKDNNYARRESYAVKIATEIIETAKATEFDEISFKSDSLFIEELDKNYKKSSKLDSETEEEIYEYTYYTCEGNDEEHYQIQIGLSKNGDETSQQDLAKKIKVTVIYPVGNKEKEIDISTVIENTKSEDVH